MFYCIIYRINKITLLLVKST